MRKRKKRHFLKKHILSITFVAVILISLGSLIAYKQIQSAKIARQEFIAREQAWPPIEHRLLTALQTFDETAANGEVSMELLSELDWMLSYWREFRSMYPNIYFPGSDDLLKDIENRRQLYLSDLLWKSSLENETKAKELHRLAGEHSTTESDALELMKGALADQKRINDEFPESHRSNYPRSAELQCWIHTIEAEPLFLQLQQSKTKADTSLSTGDWAGALKQLHTAVHQQSQINQSFPDSPQADFTEILCLEDKIHEAEAQLLKIQSQDDLEKAQAYLETEREQNALEFMGRALELQNRINLEYPHTTAFSSEKADEIATRIQTIKAKKLITHIHNMDQDLDLLLSVEMLDKIAYKLDDIQKAFVSLKQNYPLYPNPPMEIQLKASYLQTKFDVLPEILTLFKTAIHHEISIEGASFYLSDLISQILFEKVMDINPSLNPSADLPVDSISFEDAQLFCKRLSQITSRPVSIPTEQDYRLLDPELESIDPQILWEWFIPSENLPDGKAMTIQFRTEKVETQTKDVFFRSRSVGFRVKSPGVHP